MAVTTTVQDILNGAYAKSKKNNPGRIATESTELLEVVKRSLRGLYSFAARINPAFFAETASVAFASGGWARPETAESIWRIENPSNVEVVVVPIEDRAAEVGKPAVYEFGKQFRGAGNASDPTSGNLTFFYSRRPTDATALTSTLDAQWVEQFNELLMLEVAIYLAIKDERPGELPELKTQRDAWAKQYIAFLEHATVNVVRRWGHIQRFNSPTMVPLFSLLAGTDAQAA